jgi:hypothetical protein
VNTGNGCSPVIEQERYRHAEVPLLHRYENKYDERYVLVQGMKGDFNAHFEITNPNDIIGCIYGGEWLRGEKERIPLSSESTD